MPRRYKAPGVYVQEISAGPRVIEAAETSLTAFVGTAGQGPLDEPTAVRSLAEFSREFGETSDAYPLSHAVRQFFDNGGRRAVIVRVADRGFAEPALSMNQRGLWALEKIPSFNLLAIPPFSLGGDVDVRSLRTALAYCKKRRAMLLVDPRSNWSFPISVLDPGSGIDGLGLRDPNAVLYYPNILFPNPTNHGISTSFAPCGAIAGLISRTDETRGVWKAPAGVEARVDGASGLERSLTAAENRLLNQAGVNCLRSFPKTGVVCWGARTLDGADSQGSEWKYLPVRRTALFIEESLYRDLRWVVFEPNGEPLWTDISNSVENFLFTLFREGALQGTKLNEAFFVRCDRTTTSQSDIDRGVINVQVGFAPLKPAEFVILTLRPKAAGAA